MRSVRRAQLLVLTALVTAGIVLPSVPSYADVNPATVATGDMAFDGTARLSKFPCEQPPPVGNGPCAGTFSGEWAGHLSGDVGLDAFDVSWTTVQTGPTDADGVSAAFQFSELLCANLETLAGFAVGGATAYAGPSNIRGSYQRPGELLPRDITGVYLTSTFEWARTVNNAVLLFRTFDLRLNVAGLGWLSVVVNRQAGDAAFALTPPSAGVPSCASPWPNAEATVAGNVPLVQGPVELL